MSKIITVFGATGQQGGSVVDAVLADAELSKEYKVRAVTRDPSRDSGKALAAKGVEVVKADLNDKASVEAAVKGASVVFGVTNYWEKMDPEIERTQGKTIADAAAAANVDYLIWSSLPHVTSGSGGKLKEVEHFDSKADVEKHIREAGTPAAFYMPAVFYSGVQNMYRPSDDGSITLASIFHHDTKVPFTEPANDAGVFVVSAIKNPLAFQNQDIIGAGGWYTPDELAAGLAKKTGKKVTYHQLADDQMREAMKQNPKGEELVQNLIWARDFGYYGKDGEAQYQETLKLVSGHLTTWEDYLNKTWPWQK